MQLCALLEKEDPTKQMIYYRVCLLNPDGGRLNLLTADVVLYGHLFTICVLPPGQNLSGKPFAPGVPLGTLK